MTLRRCLAVLSLLVAVGAASSSPAAADAGTTLMDTPSVAEGDAGTTNLVFTVTIGGTPLTSPASVDYFTNNAGTASPPGDYADTSGTLTFVPGGPTTQQIVVPVVGDTVREPDETVPVTMTNAVNATVSQAIHVGTIVNDDPVPSITIADGFAQEGGPMGFTVTLSNRSSQTITVDYTTFAGSADGDVDYVVETGTVSFPAIFQTQIGIDTIEDALDEPDETFTVVLSNPVGATIADGTGVGTIIDNDLAAVTTTTTATTQAVTPAPVGGEPTTTTSTTSSPTGGAGASTSTTAAPAVRSAGAADLPRTGAAEGRLATIGLGAVAAGALLRRRSTRLRAGRN